MEKIAIPTGQRAMRNPKPFWMNPQQPSFTQAITSQIYPSHIINMSHNVTEHKL